MPRGCRTSEPEVLAKRAMTLRKRREQRCAVLAERLLRNVVGHAGDIQACRAWLRAKGLNIASTEVSQATRRRWVYRARRAMCGR